MILNLIFSSCDKIKFFLPEAHRDAWCA